MRPTERPVTPGTERRASERRSGGRSCRFTDLHLSVSGWALSYTPSVVAAFVTLIGETLAALEAVSLSGVYNPAT